MHIFTIPECTACATENLTLADTLPACVGAQISQEEAAFTASYGQIQPLLAGGLTAHGGHLQVLSGFSTFLALKTAGFPQIACWILSQEIAPASAFALRILHNRQACLNSPILQAWHLKEAQAQLPVQDLLPLLPLMGLKPQPHVLTERISLLQADDVVQAALHNQELHLKNLQHLLRLPQEEQKRLIELIRQYRLGGSKQQKLVDLVVDLYLREGCGIEEILAKWRQRDPPRDNLPQETQSLLGFLHCLANPRIAQAEAHFNERLQRLQPPAQVSVFHTPAFEDEQVGVQLCYSSWGSLQAHWPQVLKAVERENQDP